MNKVKFSQLSPGDIYTMTTNLYIDCLISGELNASSFKPIAHYKRRFIPIRWYQKLLFWTWIKKIDLVDIEFVGG